MGPIRIFSVWWFRLIFFIEWKNADAKFYACDFSKNVSSKDRGKPWFFVTFYIILKHIFPEDFIEFTQVVQKI